MKKYYYYSKNDKNKECISTVKMYTLDNAIIYFSKVKGLSATDFMNIYNVEEIKD